MILQRTFLELPIPPRLNGGYWGFHGHRRFLIKEAVAYKKTVLEAVLAQPVRFGEDRLGVSITLHFRDRRKSDLDGRLKSLLDALCQAGLFLDDSQVDELTVRRGEIIKGGCAKVEIFSLQTEKIQA